MGLEGGLLVQGEGKRAGVCGELAEYRNGDRVVGDKLTMGAR
jgi:hypothetical protein